MTDKNFYIEKIKAKFQIDSDECRHAIGYIKTAETDIVIKGFVVGDKYFINSTTFEIYEKSAFYLINYIDEMAD